MSDERKTPQVKKAADYKKQHRAHHNNDKSAREWIPLAKARTHRKERSRLNTLIRSAEKSGDEAIEDLTAARLNANRVTEHISKGFHHTLKEHIKHQQEKRRAATVPPNVSYSWFALERYEQSYFDPNEHLKIFTEEVRRFERHSGKVTPYHRSVMLSWKESLEAGNPFFTSLFAFNNRWEPRVRKLIARFTKEV